MMKKRDLQILHHLRNDAKQTLTNVSRKTNIPVTTIYDRVRAYKNNIIKKHTVLLDFSKLGLHIKTQIAIKTEKDARGELAEFLSEQSCINSLYRINGVYDFIAECLFKNFLDFNDFIDKLEKNFRILDIKKFNIVDEIKKEEFLTKNEHINFL